MKFTKLTIGDTVASGSGRAWKVLSTQSEETSNFTLSDGSVLVTSDGQIFNAKEE